MNLRQIKPLGFDLVYGCRGALAVDVKSQDQEHVNEVLCAQVLAAFKPRQVGIQEDLAVALAGGADVDAQFSRHYQYFIPDFGFGGAVWIYGDGFFFEDYGLVPGIFVTVVHRGQERAAVLDFLRPRWRRSRQTSSQTN